MKMKVKKACPYNEVDSEINITNITSDLIEYDKMKHDALILEHCPKIFSQIRYNDNISEKELEKYYTIKLAVLTLS